MVWYRFSNSASISLPLFTFISPFLSFYFPSSLWYFNMLNLFHPFYHFTSLLFPSWPPDHNSSSSSFLSFPPFLLFSPLHHHCPYSLSLHWPLLLFPHFSLLFPSFPPLFPFFSTVRGVVRVDVNLQDVDIDQCSKNGWFAGTHRCNLTSMDVSLLHLSSSCVIIISQH